MWYTSGMTIDFSLDDYTGVAEDICDQTLDLLNLYLEFAYITAELISDEARKAWGRIRG